MSIKTEDDLILANMLMHGHNTDIKLLELSEKLVDLAVLLAINEDYVETGFNITSVKPKIFLRNAQIFLRQNLVLHDIPYCTQNLLKKKLDGRIIKEESELLELYNSLGTMVDPFNLPVTYVKEPYYYGNVSLGTNLSDEREFLEKMRLYFEGIQLSNRTNDMSSVCYVHEIMHTQVESLKGSVRDYYNGEFLSIFLELVYSYNKGYILGKETLKNRINLLLMEFDDLFKYLYDKEYNKGKFHAVIACKYIVSTVKAINLFNRYINAGRIEQEYIMSSMQKVIDGFITLDEVLDDLGITYKDSLDFDHVKSLIYRKAL